MKNCKYWNMVITQYTVQNISVNSVVVCYIVMFGNSFRLQNLHYIHKKCIRGLSPIFF